MQLLHTLKTGKTKYLDLSGLAIETVHAEQDGTLTHLGWVVKGTHDEKGHQYGLLFTPEEAEKFQEALTHMLSRFKAKHLDEFIQQESHED